MKMRLLTFLYGICLTCNLADAIYKELVGHIHELWKIPASQNNGKGLETNAFSSSKLDSNTTGLPKNELSLEDNKIDPSTTSKESKEDFLNSLNSYLKDNPALLALNAIDWEKLPKVFESFPAKQAIDEEKLNDFVDELLKKDHSCEYAKSLLKDQNQTQLDCEKYENALQSVPLIEGNRPIYALQMALFSGLLKERNMKQSLKALEHTNTLELVDILNYFKDSKISIPSNDDELFGLIKEEGKDYGDDKVDEHEPSSKDLETLDKNEQISTTELSFSEKFENAMKKVDPTAFAVFEKLNPSETNRHDLVDAINENLENVNKSIIQLGTFLNDKDTKISPIFQAIDWGQVSGIFKVPITTTEKKKEQLEELVQLVLSSEPIDSCKEAQKILLKGLKESLDCKNYNHAKLAFPDLQNLEPSIYSIQYGLIFGILNKHDMTKSIEILGKINDKEIDQILKTLKVDLVNFNYPNDEQFANEINSTAIKLGYTVEIESKDQEPEIKINQVVLSKEEETMANFCNLTDENGKTAISKEQMIKCLKEQLAKQKGNYSQEQLGLIDKLDKETIQKYLLAMSIDKNANPFQLILNSKVDCKNFINHFISDTFLLNMINKYFTMAMNNKRECRLISDIIREKLQKLSKTGDCEKRIDEMIDFKNVSFKNTEICKELTERHSSNIFTDSHSLWEFLVGFEFKKLVEHEQQMRPLILINDKIRLNTNYKLLIMEAFKRKDNSADVFIKRLLELETVFSNASEPIMNFYNWGDLKNLLDTKVSTDDIYVQALELVKNYFKGNVKPSCAKYNEVFNNEIKTIDCQILDKLSKLDPIKGDDDDYLYVQAALLQSWYTDQKQCGVVEFIKKVNNATYLDVIWKKWPKETPKKHLYLGNEYETLKFMTNQYYLGSQEGQELLSKEMLPNNDKRKKYYEQLSKYVKDQKKLVDYQVCLDFVDISALDEISTLDVIDEETLVSKLRTGVRQKWIKSKLPILGDDLFKDNFPITADVCIPRDHGLPIGLVNFMISKLDLKNVFKLDLYIIRNRILCFLSSPILQNALLTAKDLKVEGELLKTIKTVSDKCGALEINFNGRPKDEFYYCLAHLANDSERHTKCLKRTVPSIKSAIMVDKLSFGKAIEKANLESSFERIQFIQYLDKVLKELSEKAGIIPYLIPLNMLDEDAVISNADLYLSKDIDTETIIKPLTGLLSDESARKTFKANWLTHVKLLDFINLTNDTTIDWKTLKLRVNKKKLPMIPELQKILLKALKIHGEMFNLLDNADIEKVAKNVYKEPGDFYTNLKSNNPKKIKLFLL